MMRVAMMNRVFIETEEGRVRHSAASRMLKQESTSMDACGFLVDEMFVCDRLLPKSIFQKANFTRSPPPQRWWRR